ncbi:MAG: HlyD family type I secretion periplasmic adaptor subunit [Rhodospirillaceae bacterium]
MSTPTPKTPQQPKAPLTKAPFNNPLAALLKRVSRSAADVPPTRAAFHTGMAIVVVFFGLGGAWAASAELSSAAVAHGRVTVDSNRKTIQHLEGGIIRTLHVKDGDTVNGGDPLITLEDAQSRATWDLLNAQFMSLRALEARLVAERDGLDSIVFPQDLRTTQDDAEAIQVMAGQKSLLENRRRALGTRHNILNQRISQLRLEIDSLNNQKAATDQQIALVTDEEATVRGLVRKGLERKPRLQALERERARLEGERQELAGAIVRAGQQIGEAEFEATGLDHEFQTEVAAELRETQTSIADLRERMAAAADVLKRQVVLAPMAGVVVDMQYFTPGGVITPGRAIMDIVPKGDDLIVEAKLRPTDVDTVVAGLKAEVNFTGFKARTTPTLKGNVTYVSPDSLKDERTDQHYYTARVSIPPDQLALLGDQVLTPGMPADVLIVTGERTALQYLVQPLTESFRRAFREL